MATAQHRLGDVGIIVGMVVFSEGLCILGAVLAVGGLGGAAFRHRAGTASPLRSALHARSEYRELVQRVGSSPTVRFGFYLNFAGAIGTAFIIASGILLVLPKSAWVLASIPILDIVSAIAWRAPLVARLRQHPVVSPQVIIRPATVQDIADIVKVDDCRYGDITLQTTDDPAEMFAARIRNSHGWFWVAVVEGQIEGLLAAQPTKLRIDNFVSWEHSTAKGTFEATYDPDSPVVYVAALTVSPRGSAVGVTDQLILRALQQRILERRKEAFFSGRMPRVYRFADKMSAEEYYSATRPYKGKEVALDPQIRYYESLGLRRIRLVPDGFPADWQSHGYRVLFRVVNPFYRLPFRTPWHALVGILASHTLLLNRVSRLMGG